jgi:hypothetical protein
VRPAGVVEDPFRGGRLTGIDVRHDADIAHFFERCDSRHIELFSFQLPASRRRHALGLMFTVSEQWHASLSANR